MTAVAQLFTTEKDYETYVCFNNFRSFLMPCEENTDINFDLILNDKNGNFLLKQKFFLGKGCSQFISVNKILKEESVDYNDVGLSICSPEKSIGVPFFYTMFYNQQSDCLQTVHPQDRVGAGPWNVEADGAWMSDYKILKHNNLTRLKIYQANTSLEKKNINYLFRDEDTKENILAANLSLNPLSAKCVDIDLLKVENRPKRMCMLADQLPSENGKPLIVEVYKNNLFCLEHG